MEISNTELIIRMISEPGHIISSPVCGPDGRLFRQMFRNNEKTKDRPGHFHGHGICIRRNHEACERSELPYPVGRRVQGCGQYYRCVPSCLWTGYVLPV